MSIIGMELREADWGRREIIGAVAPYDEVTHLITDPGGEVLLRGAFTKSITERADKIPLFLNHDHGTIHGFSTHWQDSPTELIGVFKVREGDAGDKLIIDARDGYLPGMSIDFARVQFKRRRDGVVAVAEGKLLGASMVTIAAYEGGKVLATRSVAPVETRAAEVKRIDIDALFGPAPVIDLSPLPPFWR